MFKHYIKNTLGRDFVVGDIHGCFAKLAQSLMEIGFDETKDRLFSVGDLVDRGPDSEASQEWLAKPWFHAVRGNHEQMAIDAANGLFDPYTYAYNGGAWFLGLTQPERQFFADLFSALPLCIEVETDRGLIGIVHADCPTENWDKFTSRISEQEVQNCAMWSRDRINLKNTSGVAGLAALYVGHTPLKSKTQLGNVHYIDTGAVFSGPLTIVQIQ